MSSAKSSWWRLLILHPSIHSPQLEGQLHLFVFTKTVHSIRALRFSIAMHGYWVRVLGDVGCGFIGVMQPTIRQMGWMWRSCIALIIRGRPVRCPNMCDSCVCCDNDNNETTCYSCWLNEQCSPTTLHVHHTCTRRHFFYFSVLRICHSLVWLH